MNKRYAITINQDEGFQREKIIIPDGWLNTFPAIAALLILQQQIDNATLPSIMAELGFLDNRLWRELLDDESEASIYNFPPEILIVISHSLEIQAALTLIRYATQHKIELQIISSLPAFATTPRLVSLLQGANDLEESAANLIPQQLLTLLSLNLNDITAEQLSAGQKNYFKSTKHNQTLLAFLFANADYFTELNLHDCTEQEAVLYSLWQYQFNQRRVFNAKIHSPLARHYINAATSASDEVVIDQLFLPAYQNAEQNIAAQAIFLYCHIRCGLAYDITKLDKLIDQCRAQKLSYWLAYFLSYGQVIRSYSENYQRRADIVRLSEAYRIYKSMCDWACVTRALHSKSTLMSKNLQFKNASRYLEICLSIRLYLQDTLGIARVLNGISYLQSQLENFSKAISYSKQAVDHLLFNKQYEELAFTFSQISWYNFLIDKHEQAVLYGEQTLATMQDKNIQSLPFRTKPDIHAQLGLAFFFSGQVEQALEHSNYCEAHKVDSTATGEILRILLRAMINDSRGDSHLADISFEYIPQLLTDNVEIDPHIELVYNRILLERYQRQNVQWRAADLRRKSLEFCRQRGYHYSRRWFEQSSD